MRFPFDIHHHHHLDREVMSLLGEISHKIDLNQEQTMTAFTDLQAAIAALATELESNNAAIDALLLKIVPGTSDADIQTAITQIQALTNANKAEVAKISP